VQRYKYSGNNFTAEFATTAVMNLGKWLKSGSNIFENRHSDCVSLKVEYRRKDLDNITNNFNILLCTFYVIHHVMLNLHSTGSTYFGNSSKYMIFKIRINNDIMQKRLQFKKAIQYLQITRKYENHTDKYVSEFLAPQFEYLPDYIKQFQQPLYDKLRSIFDQSVLINSSSGFENFRVAVETWLLYIQPWSSKDMKLGDFMLEKSIPYSDDWKEYVASNYHFYTTLLILFCKAVGALSRELIDDQKKLQVIQTVLNVFDENLTAAIHEIHDACKDVLYLCNPKSGYQVSNYVSNSDVSHVMKLQLCVPGMCANIIIRLFQ
jgi:hypothetical protein